MIGDAILILGGLAFWLLSALCRWRRGWVWRLYSLEPRWRKDNPERSADWDAKTARSALVYALLGLAFIALGLLL